MLEQGPRVADISTSECPRPAIILAAALALCACSPTAGQAVGQRPAPTAAAHERSSEDRAHPSAGETGAKEKLSGKPLKGGALFAALNDAYVEPVRPAGHANVKNWPGEIFQSDGYYAQVSNGTRRYGSYQVNGDVLCIEGDDIKRSCRHLVHNLDSTYSFIDLSNRLTTRVTIRSRHAVNSWLVDGQSPAYIDYAGQRYIKLNADAIFPTLFDHKLSHVPGSLLSLRYFTESFHIGKVYIMSMQETPSIGGTWNVANDSVCVVRLGDSKLLCRQVYINNNKTQVLLVEETGDRRHYALSRSNH
ncbi:MAG TPA: hypothetical protein VE053_12535 [Allosphingosinicella sp.]|nr:hypothetical protein [Allosphingosinicella sp.]